MKLVSTEFGQVLQLYAMEEIRPLSGLHLPDVIQAVAQRYRFSGVPTDVDAAISNGAKFKNGVTEMEGRTIAITECGIFTDGILLSTRNTIDSDLVVDDLISWLTFTFKLRDPTTIHKRKYSSNVVIDFDHSIDGALRDFNRLSAPIMAALSAAHDREIKVHVNKLTIGCDPSEGIPLVQASFSIEPRANKPFCDLRYFSGASLPTNVHLELLEAMEKALS